MPKGLSWPPQTKSDDDIFSEMLELGAKLKECTLGLGDGGSERITIPIH